MHAPSPAVTAADALVTAADAAAAAVQSVEGIVPDVDAVMESLLAMDLTPAAVMQVRGRGALGWRLATTSVQARL